MLYYIQYFILLPSYLNTDKAKILVSYNSNSNTVSRTYSCTLFFV